MFVHNGAYVNPVYRRAGFVEVLAKFMRNKRLATHRTRLLRSHANLSKYFSLFFIFNFYFFLLFSHTCMCVSAVRLQLRCRGVLIAFWMCSMAIVHREVKKLIIIIIIKLRNMCKITLNCAIDKASTSMLNRWPPIGWCCNNATYSGAVSGKTKYFQLLNTLWIYIIGWLDWDGRKKFEMDLFRMTRPIVLFPFEYFESKKLVC